MSRAIFSNVRFDSPEIFKYPVAIREAPETLEEEFGAVG